MVFGGGERSCGGQASLQLVVLLRLLPTGNSESVYTNYGINERDFNSEITSTNLGWRKRAVMKVSTTLDKFTLKALSSVYHFRRKSLLVQTLSALDVYCCLMVIERAPPALRPYPTRNSNIHELIISFDYF